MPTGPSGTRRTGPDAATDVAGSVGGATDGEGRLRGKLDATRAELEACRDALSRIAKIATPPAGTS